MSGSDRGGDTKTVDWGLPLVGILVALFIAWGIGWLQAREEYKRHYAPTSYAEAAKQDALESCAGTDPSAVFKCVNEKTKTAYQTAHDEQDLTAQQRAASSALATSVLSFLALVLSGVGVWFVKRTLDATLKAVEDTGRATNAMERQNEIALSAHRAWISISFKIEQFTVYNGVLKVAYEVEFKNIGQTIAQSVWHYVLLSAEGAEFGKKLRAYRGEWSKPKGPSTLSLMPNESKVFRSMGRFRVDELPWYGPNNDLCNVVINATAFYHVVGEEGFDKRKTTMRAARLGMPDATDALRVLISRRELMHGTEFEPAVSITGESITT